MDFEAINCLRLKEAFGEFELFQRIFVAEKAIPPIDLRKKESEDKDTKRSRSRCARWWRASAW